MAREYEFGIVPSAASPPVYKSVFNPRVARNLIRRGNIVYDIKADKREPQRTIFIFEATGKFWKDLEEINSRKEGDGNGKAASASGKSGG